MSEKENLILASLLHDIGKFAVLGGEKLSSEYDKNLRNIYCPNKYGYNHLLYSGQFVKEVFEGKASLIENLVLSHHIPENFQGNKKLPKIIQIADWLSSGERRGREDKEGIEFKKEPIISI
ncbi:MAG: HD domain-containing protein, partial [bacterium]|nr:HD domain-containing protein [bacterium]MDW8163718.1 HD domain-containing protein [Candidatus Omnitrophota bacterium]